MNIEFEPTAEELRLIRYLRNNPISMNLLSTAILNTEHKMQNHSVDILEQFIETKIKTEGIKIRFPKAKALEDMHLAT